MNLNQKILYAALEIIANSNMRLDDAVGIAKEMTKDEVQQVINKFENIITEFDVKYMYENSYNFEYYASRIIDDVVAKLKEED